MFVLILLVFACWCNAWFYIRCLGFFGVDWFRVLMWLYLCLGIVVYFRLEIDGFACSLGFGFGVCAGLFWLLIGSGFSSGVLEFCVTLGLVFTFAGFMQGLGVLSNCFRLC